MMTSFLARKRKSRTARKHRSRWQRFWRITAALLLFFIATSCLSVLLLRWIPPVTTAFMCYRHYQDFQENRPFTRIDFSWTSLDRISPQMAKAVIAAEDQRFLRHRGFDFDAMLTAVDDYFEQGRLRGASTITQQVAKNLFLVPAKSFLRKIVEAWFTVLIESMWSKRRIIEVYLNIAEFGDHLFGVEQASRRYFGIPADRLNASQAALLAATLPNPGKFHADRPSSYLRQRQGWILAQMTRLPRRYYASLFAQNQ